MSNRPNYPKHINSPCQDCKERHFKCHAECERYKAYKAELEKANEAERIQNGISGARRESKAAHLRRQYGHYDYNRVKRYKGSKGFRR